MKNTDTTKVLKSWKDTQNEITLKSVFKHC